MCPFLGIKILHHVSDDQLLQWEIPVKPLSLTITKPFFTFKSFLAQPNVFLFSKNSSK